ncbi:acylphosphatase [Selenomonas caprae]|uniref:Acylphosphatase n=1 Tax=Selenomonas caprae TaxID=2606905 RepID=A0A5D6WSN5_9FIRM|nr:acylphosphatase [Selenomonas caprae]TYZ30953.1 acylphosphatase [Selenomonas caprae]
MRYVAVALAMFCSFLCMVPSVLAAPAPRIEQVTAKVTAAGSLPPLVQERMEQSVGAIARQLLEGKTVAETLASRQQQEQLIHEVFDKVLVGYTVKGVDIQPSQTATVAVELYPWADTIQQVDVKTSVEGMSPRIEKLVRQDIAGVEQVFQAALTGLPTAASDWTNGVLKHHLNDYLAEHLPEFRADFELDPEQVTKVQLVLYPRLPVVRTVDLSMRSDTVPNFTLLNHRQLVQEKADELVGVPVAFVARHKQELSRQFAEELDCQPDFRVMHMKTQMTLEVAEQLQIMSRSDTSRYRLRLTGWGDAGRKNIDGKAEDENLMLRLHAGSMLSRQDELFLLLDFAPQAVKWRWELGYDRMLSPYTHGQIRYDFTAGDFVLAATQQLAPRWLLRYEYRLDDALGETAVRYKLHDFLSVEYLINRRQKWFRFIGNF